VGIDGGHKALSLVPPPLCPTIFTTLSLYHITYPSCCFVSVSHNHNSPMSTCNILFVKYAKDPALAGVFLSVTAHFELGESSRLLLVNEEIQEYGGS
jgi:hypothetical protein